MSSTPTSSSSSRSQRPPLHERSNSEKNRLAIRIVPYSPPRPEEHTGSSHGQDTGIGHDGSHLPANDPVRTSPTRRKGSIARDEPYAMHPGSAMSSPASSTTSLVRAKGSSVSGTKLGSDSSGVGPSTPPPAHSKPSYGSNISRVNAPSQHDEGLASPTRTTAKSRAAKHIAVHSDKTFSIVLNPTGARVSDRTESSIRSPPLSTYSTISSHEGVSFDAHDDDRPGSALSSLPERSVSPYTPGSVALPEAAEDHTTASPWNYRMVGGLRKVAQTPDLKGKDREFIGPGPSSPLPTLPEIPSSPLAAKPSFNSQASEQTDSTIEETTNYKVIGRSSPPLADSDSIEVPPSSSDSNYQLLGESSPAQPFLSSPPQALLDTPGSRNFIVHGETPSSSLPTASRNRRPQYSDDSLVLRGKYSQESLIVPPLKPVRRKSSHERFGYYKQISRESLRRANSWSSISSIISQDAASTFLASTPNIIRLGSTPSTSSLRQQQSSWAGPSSAVPPRLRMETETHQWSSQLSTVMSEYEGSDPGSRHLSVSSGPEHRRTSYGSRHSRQMMSISSSLSPAEEVSESSQSRSHSRSNSRTDSLDRPQPPYMRGAREGPSPPTRTVRDVDEDGDGLTDLHYLQHKSSRQRLAHLLSHKSSDRDLHSSGSSRAGSLTPASLPAWARLYYGSGERRGLAPLSIRSYSDDSRPASSFVVSDSPSNDQFPPNIFSPRRRPREVNPGGDRPVSTEVTHGLSSMRLGVRKMTSSIWSPHLHADRRASRMSIWQPPSMTWSADEGPFGRRNIQIILFVVGFVFPFAWMIAAFLPLPLKPAMTNMAERDHSITQFNIPEEPEPFISRVHQQDDKRYQSGRWWRNLNRLMSVVGLLVIGAIVALAIVGYWQNLGRQ